MATQMEKIKEMASKKLLNGEQKKVLYKLFESKINQKLEEKRAQYNREESEKENEVLKNGKKNPVIKRMLEKIIEAGKEIDKIEDEIKKMGFYLDYHKELQGSNTPEMDKLRKENRKKLNSIADLKTKLLADIHGLPMSYDEMVGYIEGQLSAINKK